MRIFVLGLALFSLNLTAGDRLIPWMTANDTFSGVISVNNLSAQDSEIFLVATRGDGAEAVAFRELGPFSQLVEDAANLFPSLAGGRGFTVIVSSASTIETGFVIRNIAGASGSSPAQANAVSLDDNSPDILFNYMTIPQGGASAPVVVNLGVEPASVVFHAYQNGAIAASSEPVTVASGQPFAEVTSTLFPDLSGAMYIIASSDQPLTGMAFIFNEFGEPSMANSVALESAPESNP